MRDYRSTSGCTRGGPSRRQRRLVACLAVSIILWLPGVSLCCDPAVAALPVGAEPQATTVPVTDGPHCSLDVLQGQPEWLASDIRKALTDGVDVSSVAIFATLRVHARPPARCAGTEPRTFSRSLQEQYLLTQRLRL